MDRQEHFQEYGDLRWIYPKYNWWQNIAYYVENLDIQDPISSDDWLITDLWETGGGDTLSLPMAVMFSSIRHYVFRL